MTEHRLSSQQLQFFDTFGFLSFPGLLADCIDEIIEAFEAVWTERGGGHGGKPHDGSARSCIVPFIDQHERLCALLDDPRVEGLLCSLLGDDFNYMSSDGNRGVIMVAGMEPPNPSTSYDIWLMRGHDKVRAGRVEVDSRGWGTVSLLLPEPIMGFEKVELTLNAVLKASQTQSDMVLEGNLVSMNTPRFVA